MIPSFVTFGLFLSLTGNALYGEELYTWHLRQFQTYEACVEAIEFSAPAFQEQYKNHMKPGSLRLWCVESQET